LIAALAGGAGNRAHVELGFPASGAVPAAASDGATALVAVASRAATTLRNGAFVASRANLSSAGRLAAFVRKTVDAIVGQHIIGSGTDSWYIYTAFLATEVD